VKPIGITQADPKNSGKHPSLVFAILVLRIQAMVYSTSQYRQWPALDSANALARSLSQKRLGYATSLGTTLVTAFAGNTVNSGRGGSGKPRGFRLHEERRKRYRPGLPRESPRVARLYHRKGNQITLEEVERIAI